MIPRTESSLRKMSMASPVVALSLAALLAISGGPLALADWTEDATFCATIQADHQRAISYCTKAIESGQLTEDDLAVTYNNRAFELTEAGRYDEALADIEMALRLDSDSAAAWNTRGRIFLNTERHQEAIADFKEALVHIKKAESHENITVGLGTKFDANFNIAIAYQALDDLENGKAFAQSAFEIAPDAPFAQDLFQVYGLR